MVPAGLQHRRLHLRWHLMRIHPRGRCERSANCSRPPASYLASQACSVCRDTPTAAATSLTVRPSLITASPARYRCSATLISLIRECQGSTELSTISRNHVKHQPKAKSQASAEGIHRIGSRLGESNPGPTHYECVALPAELRRHMRHCPRVARDRQLYRDWSWAIEVELGCDLADGRAKRVLDWARILRPGPWQLQQVVLFRGTTLLFK